MDEDLFIKVITILLSAGGGIYQWRNSRFRSRLKDDLQILTNYEVYGKGTKGYEALKADIDATIERAYSPSQKGFSKERIPDLIVGFVFLVGSILLVWQKNATGLGWWATLLAILFAFISIGGFINAFSSNTIKS